jgi:hypothetical protein
LYWPQMQDPEFAAGITSWTAGSRTLPPFPAADTEPAGGKASRD